MVRLQSSWVGKERKSSFLCEFDFLSTLIFLVLFFKDQKIVKGTITVMLYEKYNTRGITAARTNVIF